MMKNLIAKDLLSIGAVFLRPEDPFTWASGIKSPIYCDNRLTLTAPEVRNHVEHALAETIRKEYPDCEVLMGTSTAGIAHAAITAHILGLREAGAEVLGVVSIFTYGMQKGLDRLKEANVKNISLSDFDAVAEVAAKEGYIKQEDIKKLITFRNNPSDESWRNVSL